MYFYTYSIQTVAFSYRLVNLGDARVTLSNLFEHWQKLIQCQWEMGKICDAYRSENNVTKIKTVYSQFSTKINNKKINIYKNI